MGDEKKCKCNTQKEICKRMANAGLQQAVKQLNKLQPDGDVRSKFSAIATVKSMINVVTVYECLPCKCLEERAKMVLEIIEEDNTFREKAKAATAILAAEAEAFLQH